MRNGATLIIAAIMAMTATGASATMRIGDQWVREARSVVLAVPSAIVPAERNFLLNPAHPDFRKVRQHKPVEFAFDARLVGR